MDSQSTSNGTASIPSKRSRAGCLTCRARRVKCDETPGECMRCRNLSVVCKWGEKRDILGSSPRSPPSARPRPRSAAGRPTERQSTSPSISAASNSCTLPHEPPRPAVDESLDSENARTGSSGGDTEPTLPISSTPLSALMPSAATHPVDVAHIGPIHGHSASATVSVEDPFTTPPSLEIRGVPLDPSGLIGITRVDLNRHVDAFFSHVYPVQGMSFVHRGTLIREIAARTAPPILVKAICAVSARFLDDADQSHPDGGERAATWTNEVKMLLIVDTDRLSLAKLAATLCLIHHEFNSGRLVSASTYVSIATKFAFSMGLHVEPTGSNLTWTNRETRRRLIWATFCADCLFAGGEDKFMGCKAEFIDAALPCSEVHFNFGPPIVCPKLCHVRSPPSSGTDLLAVGPLSLPLGVDGLTSRWIRLMDIRSDLLKLTKHSHELLPRPWEPGSLFNAVLARLSHWKVTLPPQLELTTENLYAHSGSSTFSSLVTIHLFHDQFQAAVYRSILQLDDGSLPKDFLELAPRSWLQESRTLAYVCCGELVKKLEILERDFGD